MNPCVAALLGSHWVVSKAQGPVVDVSVEGYTGKDVWAWSSGVCWEQLNIAAVGPLTLPAFSSLSFPICQLD